MLDAIVQFIEYATLGLEWLYSARNPFTFTLGLVLGYSIVSFMTYWSRKHMRVKEHSEQWWINYRWTESAKHLGFGVSMIVFSYVFFWGGSPNFFQIILTTTLSTLFCVLLTGYIIDLTDIIHSNKMEKNKRDSNSFTNKHYDIDSIIEVLYEIRDEIRSKEKPK